MVKYEREYKETSNKDDFVKLVVRRKLTSKTNAIKRYSDMKKKFGEQKQKKTIMSKNKKKTYTPNKLKKQLLSFLVDNEGFVVINLTIEDKIKGVRVKFKRKEGGKLRTIGLQIDKE